MFKPASSKIVFRLSIVLLVLTFAEAPLHVLGAPKTSAANIEGSAQQVVIFQPDPKLRGKFLFKIWAAGGSAQSVSNDFTSSLHNVTAYLFQKGKAAAKMTAPAAHASNASQSVTATGRVHILSLTQPGTTIDADTVVWHARSNIVDATGHVVFRNGKNGATLQGPHFQANTALQTIQSVGAGQASF